MNPSGGQLSAGDSQKGATATISRRWFSDRLYLLFLSTFLGLNIFFNITDIVTTSIALRLGLTEGNGFVLVLANYLGLSIVGTLAFVKIIFIFGTSTIAIIGMLSKNPRTRNNVLILMACAAMALLIVSANNIFWIATTI
jgi:hypothetical protein